MKLNELSNVPGSKKQRKRVGRGIGSGKGKTCGSGVKGQKARAGVAIKGFEGGQMPLIARLPKRGFNSINPKKYLICDFAIINYFFEHNIITSDVTHVNKELLESIGFIKSSKDRVKLLSCGELTRKLIFELDAYSVSAKNAVEAFGGKVI
jgi:large subunit ribosomal protein L15